MRKVRGGHDAPIGKKSIPVLLQSPQPNARAIGETMTSLRTSGSLIVDSLAHEVTLDGHLVHLTRAEFTLLAALAEHPRRAFSREYLTQVVTGSDWASDTHALDTVVCRLRNKLGETGSQPRRIVTVHGYGYRFEPDQTSNPVQSAFVMVDINRTIVWANDAFDHLLRWKPTELHGKVLYDLIHPDDRPRALAARADLDAGFPAAMVLRFQTRYGDYRLVEALARPVLADDRTVVAFLGEYRLAASEMKAELPILEPIHVTSVNS